MKSIHCFVSPTPYWMHALLLLFSIRDVFDFNFHVVIALLDNLFGFLNQELLTSQSCLLY